MRSDAMMNFRPCKIYSVVQGYCFFADHKTPHVEYSWLWIRQEKLTQEYEWLITSSAFKMGFQLISQGTCYSINGLSAEIVAN